MSSVSEFAPASRSDEVDRNFALLAYGLMFAAIFFAGVPALIAVAIAYAKRREVAPMIATHHRFQIFIFWVGFALVLLAGLSGLAAVLSFLVGMFEPVNPHWNGMLIFGGVAVGLGIATGAWLMTTSLFGFIRLASQHSIGQTAP
jgi:uncharacterized membrane protein